MKRLAIAILLFVVVYGVVYSVLFRAPDQNTEEKTLVVELNDTYEDIIGYLVENTYVRSEVGLRIALTIQAERQIVPGGYKISQSMNAFRLARSLTEEPALVWVVVPEGLRKEEIAELFSDKLSWGETERESFVRTAEREQMLAYEGVYYPDTYLVPRGEGGLAIAKRMFNRFNETFQPLTQRLLNENIKNDTALKIASLIQREAAGHEDMPLISGIIWNRLLNDIKLDIDATIQYARGDIGSGWWAPVSVMDKEIDSPFNTYKYKGLPPQPISNPGLSAINAVLHPTKTNCFYYLHDKEGNIHCSPTYEGHVDNIDMHL